MTSVLRRQGLPVELHEAALKVLDPPFETGVALLEHLDPAGQLDVGVVDGIDVAAQFGVSGASPHWESVSPATGMLEVLAVTWKDLQKIRVASQLRGEPALAAALLQLERSAHGRLTRALRRHELWPWLSQFPGLGGAHTAIVISRIRNPHRFPIPGRPGSGVRALWRYCGLDVVDGRSPRKRKGQRCHWDPRMRAAVLQPDGIAEQIVRHRVPVYRDIYDAQKARLTEERSAACEIGSGLADGAADGPETAEKEYECACTRGGLRPFQIDALARKIAAKAFVGDLLIAWKAPT